MDNHYMQCNAIRFGTEWIGEQIDVRIKSLSRGLPEEKDTIGTYIDTTLIRGIHLQDTV